MACMDHLSITVHGATGAQGSPVVSGLLAAGHRVTAVARHPRNLPEGTRIAAVDLADTDALCEAYSGADGVFCHLPMGEPEQLGAYARSIGRALSAARPSRIVVSTSGRPVGEAGGDQAGPLTDLVDHLRGSGLCVAVVATRLYLENLLLAPVLEPARREGVLRYPLPEAFAASWCSHQDVADAAIALLSRERQLAGTLEVGHLPGLTGPDLAAGLATGLGIEVRYQPTSPQEFAAAITPLFGREAAASVAAFYEGLAARDHWTIDSRRSAQHLLGLAPRAVEAWLGEVLTDTLDPVQHRADAAGPNGC